VSKKEVECCRDPDVAFTVMVYVADCVPPPPPPPPEVDPPPPQLLSKPRPPTLITSSNSSKRRRFLKPKQHKAAVNTARGNSGRELRCRAASAVVVLIVSVVVAAAPEGVTIAGEKLHAAPDGNPEQVNETLEVNPDSGVRVIVVDPLCPPVTVIELGDAATLKSDALNVYVTLATALLKKFEATARALMVSGFPYAPTPIPF
jgi:hypothetical protein